MVFGRVTEDSVLYSSWEDKERKSNNKFLMNFYSKFCAKFESVQILSIFNF